MESSLATLFYIGIIVPTLITISVFLGFLICLYKCKLRQQQQMKTMNQAMATRALPAMPSFNDGAKNGGKNFDKYSQHSADSAIDVGDVETSLEEKMSTGLVLDAKTLERSHHSYQNDGMQLTTEVEIHGGMLRKGYYPSHEQLNEEIHSQVKIYEKMSDIQRVALQIQQQGEANKLTGADSHCSQRDDLIAASQKQFTKQLVTEKITPRYTSTSKLVSVLHSPPTTAASNNNQLDKPSNYAFVPSWYDKEKDANNRIDLYRSHYNSSTAGLAWKPNIAASLASTTDNYSSVESSQV